MGLFYAIKIDELKIVQISAMKNGNFANFEAKETNLIKIKYWN